MTIVRWDRHEEKYRAVIDGGYREERENQMSEGGEVDQCHE